MSGTKKVIVFLLGALFGVFLMGQLALGLTILNAKTNPTLMEWFEKLTKAHQHTGYVTVGLGLLYLVTTLVIILRSPSARNA